MDLLALVHPLSRDLRRIEDDCAATAGLTMWQYAILSVAAAADGPSQKAIATRLDYSQNRLVGDLNRLGAKGLVTRERGADGRSHAIRVTERGQAAVAAVRARIHSLEDELLAHMSADQRAGLRDLLATAIHRGD
ncbi:MAG TPA: MarR family transcriptional regulator [Jatrophihabitans sp.]|nr:MarR family transcriptional regulator [Jatrophihabitans sp.]